MILKKKKKVFFSYEKYDIFYKLSWSHQPSLKENAIVILLHSSGLWSGRAVKNIENYAIENKYVNENKSIQSVHWLNYDQARNNNNESNDENRIYGVKCCVWFWQHATQHKTCILFKWWSIPFKHSSQHSWLVHQAMFIFVK